MNTREQWHSRLDSNQHRRSQSPVCCHYTTTAHRRQVKPNIGAELNRISAKTEEIADVYFTSPP